MDCLAQGLSEKSKIAVTVADVTHSAQELEHRHLCGPTAGRILGQALSAVAIMSSDIDAKDVRITAQFLVDGPVGACVVDVSGDGSLRGYTNIKILNDFDGDDNAELSGALGKHGKLMVVQSTEQKIIYQGIIHLTPPDIRAGLAKYINESMQRPAAVEIFAASKNGYLTKALAVVAEKMPDSTSELFLPVLEAFDDGRVKAMLDGEFDWKKLESVPGLEDLQIKSIKELRFNCTCSLEKVKGTLKALPQKDLKEIARAGEGQEINCHFCGKDYRISHSDILDMLE